MTTKRFLHGALLVLASAGPVSAQFGGDPSGSAFSYPGMVPSVAPAGMDPMGAGMPQMPPGRPSAAANPTSIERVTTPIQQVAGDSSAPYSTLTGQPPPQQCQPGQQGNGLPLGSYPSPYYTDGPGCCGPMGRNGRIGSELYLDTGPAWVFGGGKFTDRLEMGWMVGGGGRSLFFNRMHDAAWVLDVGVSYAYNRGVQNNPIDLDIRQPPLTNTVTRISTPQPDILTNSIIRDIDRTNFNFGLGRDWWLHGPGATGLEDCWNLRVGVLVGGRWGTAHVDVVLPEEINGYARRQNVTHGVFIQTHANFEIPLGTVIYFVGLQVQWGYDWTNLVPPIPGDFKSVNLLMNSGFRF